jgi:hypothetical protein
MDNASVAVVDCDIKLCVDCSGIGLLDSGVFYSKMRDVYPFIKEIEFRETTIDHMLVVLKSSLPNETVDPSVVRRIISDINSEIKEDKIQIHSVRGFMHVKIQHSVDARPLQPPV